MGDGLGLWIVTLDAVWIRDCSEGREEEARRAVKRLVQKRGFPTDSFNTVLHM